MRSKIGPKAQVVIPKAVREQVGLAPGDEVSFRVEDDRVVLEKTSTEAAIEAFLAAVPKKRRAPKSIDWDDAYASRFKRTGG